MQFEVREHAMKAYGV